MSEVSVLRKHLINYAKAKDVFTAYKASGYNREFYEANRDMLALRSAAKKVFDAYKKENGSDKKLPHISELNAEYANAFGTKEKLLCRVPQDQIGNARLACGAEDCAGNSERGRAEKRAAAWAGSTAGRGK